MGLDVKCKCGQTRFGAGSYHSYSWWRETLARIVGIKNIRAFWIKAGGVENRNGKEPFFELINFSDSEGTLPYKECKRLLKDFDKLSPTVHKGETLFWMKLFKFDEMSDIEWEFWVRKFDIWHEAVRHAVKDKCNIIFS